MERRDIFNALLTTAVCVAGVATANPVLITLAGGIGANLASENVAKWRDSLGERLFTPAGLLNQDLANAMKRAIWRVVEPNTLVKRFKATEEYHKLKSQDGQEAKKCLEALKKLASQTKSFLDQIVPSLEEGFRGNEFDGHTILQQGVASAQSLLNDQLQRSLDSHNLVLLSFVQQQFNLDRLSAYFKDELKRPEGEAAFKAFQLLVGDSLQVAVARQGEDMAKLSQDVAEFNRQLEWFLAQLQDERWLGKKIRQILTDLQQPVAANIERMVLGIKGYLRQGNARESRRLVNQFKKEYPDNPNVNCVSLLSQIISLSDFSLFNMPDCNSEWAAECICAYVMARAKVRRSRKKDKQKIVDALDNMRYRLPVDKVADDEPCRKKLDELESDPSQTVPCQPRVWPPRKTGPRKRLPDTTSPLKMLVEEDINIFQEGQERRTFFWGGHWVFQELLRQEQVSRTNLTFIYGKPGCGRSALAKGFSLYAASDWLVLPIPLLSPTSDLAADVQKQIVSKLWEFIEAHPTYLMRLQNEQRGLLCQVLLHTYGSPDTLNTKIWTVHNSLNGPENWTGSGKVQLRSLIPLVKKNYDPTFNCGLNSVLVCAKSLGFTQVVLVADIDNIADIEQIRQRLFPEEMSFVVFLPDSVWHSLPSIYRQGSVQSWNLHWTEKDLLKMLEEKFAAVAGIRDQLLNYFEEPQILTQLIQQSNRNPGQLMKNLRQIVNAMDIPAESIITYDHIRPLLG